MSLFVLISWLVCTATSAILTISIVRYRYLMIKPSMVVILFFHVMIQWGATIKAVEIESYLPNPYAFMLLAHGFPLIGFCFSLFYATKEAYMIWCRIIFPDKVSNHVQFKLKGLISGGILIFMVYYLAIVPLTRTGLFAIFVNPDNAAIAREYSLKLVEDPILRYGFGFMASALAPLLAVMSINSISFSFDSEQFIQNFFNIIILLGLILVVSITGARSFAASIIMTVLLSIFLRKGLPVSPLKYLFAGALILVLPAVFSILREGHIPNIVDVQNYIFGPISRRVFLDPVQGGIYHLHSAQTNGYFGLGAIPKLALLFDKDPLNVPNIIGQIYESSAIASVSSNASFVFSYYSYFGMIALPLCLMGLWLLDLIIWVYKRLSVNLLLPCVASINVACISFISSDYTTVLLTHGILFLLITSLALDRVVVSKRIIWSNE